MVILKDGIHFNANDYTLYFKSDSINYSSSIVPDLPAACRVSPFVGPGDIFRLAPDEP